MSRAAIGVATAVLVAGLALLVPAAFSTTPAGGAAVKRGGTLRYAYFAPVLATDAQTSPFYTLLNATQLTLYSFTDVGRRKEIVPAAAAGAPRVSADGRTYTFTVRRGFRFSDGRPVTPRNFAFALNRLFNPRLGSNPWAYLFEDVVGARAVLEGKAGTVSGVRTRGMRLIVRLERPQPDFVARLVHPAMSATPLDMPIPAPLAATSPSAGPYHLKEHVPGRRALLVRNPFWRRRLLPWRPANFDQILFTRPGLTGDEAIRAVERGEIDIAHAQGTASIPRLAQSYRVNGGRLFVRPTLVFWYFVFNHERPLFRNNRKLRQAINHALDRRALLRPLGQLVAGRTDQILPPLMPGFRNWHLYDRPRLRRARALARGHRRGRKAVLYTLAAGHPVLPAGRQIVRVLESNLTRIGIDVDVKTFEGGLFSTIRTPGQPWDIAGPFGWFADYADPYNFINELFDGQNVARPGDPTRQNLARFNDPVFNRRMRRAARLSGRDRLAAYARIDRDLMLRAAPIAPLFVLNDVVLVSRRLGCFNYHPLARENLVALCRK
jgi:peptide/nickel transport system substrate-binding protein